ncbi:MAG: UMP kinase [Spirochaetes bacterium]|nr:UMP kinase [Spirochaetota bacterium]
MPKGNYNKILIKLSGEFLADKNNNSISISSIDNIYQEIRSLRDSFKIQISLVIGAGNIFRGDTSRQKERFKNFSFSRVPSDKAGMLGTVINGMILADYFNQNNLPARVLSMVNIDFIEFFQAEKANEYLEKGFCLIFTGGTSNPYVSTDTAAVIKALEVDADVLIKATKVDGVYDKDPHKYTDAKLFKRIDYKKAIEEKLQVMDLSAFSLAMENNLPIIVFNFSKKGCLKKILQGETLGTLIKGVSS